MFKQQFLFVNLVGLSVVCGTPAIGQELIDRPAKPFGLSRWKLTLPVLKAGSNEPPEVWGAKLDQLHDPRHFFVSPIEGGPLVFRAYCDGVTTRNSQYPRCELRELNDDGVSDARWTTDSGVLHEMQLRMSINHLPDKKDHVVAAQIHDAEDDVLMLRLESTKLFIERNDHPRVMLDRKYQLGTPFDLRITAGRGFIRVNYQASEVMDWQVSRDGCYFKAGCYTQSNLSKGDNANAYGEVLIYRLHVSHQDHARQFVTSNRLILGTQALRSASVRAGDVDQDGDLDIVVANGRHWPQQNFLFLNQGGSRFNVARRLGEDLETSYACELGDLDRDGDLDLVMGNDNAPTAVWLGDGAGHFTKHTTLGDPTSVRGITLADVNADETLDVIVICRGRANRLFLNDGKGTFDHPISFGGESDSTLGVAVADLNRDELPDLILANRDNQPNTILFGEDESRFSSPQPFGDPSQSSRAVITADFNRDGNPDWAISNLGQSNIVYLGDGQGGVLREVPFGRPDGNTYGLAVADMNGDQSPDLVTCNVMQAGTVALNQKTAESFETIEYGSTETASYGLCVGDFDSDGDQDIAIANSDGQNRIYLNQSSSR